MDERFPFIMSEAGYRALRAGQAGSGELFAFYKSLLQIELPVKQIDISVITWGKSPDLLFTNRTGGRQRADFDCLM